MGKVNSTILSRKNFDVKGTGTKSNAMKLLGVGEIIREFDNFLTEVLEMFPVTLFPGGDDPGYQKPPFVGFDRELFIKAAKYKNFRCANANTDAIIRDDDGNACEILAISNKLKIDSDKENLQMILAGLESGQ